MRVRHVWRFLRTTAIPPPLNVLSWVLQFFIALTDAIVESCSHVSGSAPDSSMGCCASVRSVVAESFATFMTPTHEVADEVEKQRLGYVSFRARVRFIEKLETRGS